MSDALTALADSWEQVALHPGTTSNGCRTGSLSRWGARGGGGS